MFCCSTLATPVACHRVKYVTNGGLPGPVVTPNYILPPLSTFNLYIVFGKWKYTLRYDVLQKTHLIKVDLLGQALAIKMTE